MKKPWPPEDIAWLEREYANSHTPTLAAQMGRSVTSVYQMADRCGIKKSPEYLASPLAGRTDGKRGGSTRFQRGHETWNKGIKGVCGTHENCRRSQFAKGHKPVTTLPVGSYRLNSEGHLQQKTGTTSGPSSRRWRSVAELVWCKANGPLPTGHIVIFRPGMFTNQLEEITLDRVECISRAENARRNHPRAKNPELGRLVQLKGAITRQVNRIAREARESK